MLYKDGPRAELINVKYFRAYICANSNSIWLRLTEPAMNEHGSLNVNEFFQVDGHEDVFAIGDCTSVQVGYPTYWLYGTFNS